MEVVADIQKGSEDEATQKSITDDTARAPKEELTQISGKVDDNKGGEEGEVVAKEEGKEVVEDEDKKNSIPVPRRKNLKRNAKATTSVQEAGDVSIKSITKNSMVKEMTNLMKYMADERQVEN